MRRLFKYFVAFIFAICSLLIVYLIADFGLSRITIEGEADSRNEVEIFIKSNGVHTDIIVPVKTAQMDWSKEIRFINTIANDSTMPFLGIGWGDKGFYLETPTWADLKFSTALKAAFGLSTTAIHATYYRNMIE